MEQQYFERFMEVLWAIEARVTSIDAKIAAQEQVEAQHSGGVKTKPAKLLDAIEIEINRIEAQHYAVPVVVMEARINILDCVSKLRDR